MKSWHYNSFTDTSAIQEVLDVLNEENFCYIFTEESDFLITHEDKVTVGLGALMVVSDHENGRFVQLINTDKINHIEIRPIDKD